jgi:hypothetical protein
MKSFRLYFNKFEPPARFAPDFTAEELSDFRDAFRAPAERSRRYMRIGYFVLGLGFLFILSGFVLPKAYLPYEAGGFITCWLTLPILAYKCSLPDCPACHNALDQRLGSFCPECGARALSSGGLFRAPQCSSCGRAMYRRKGRGYKIRACTHCGVMLDEKGL